MSVRPVARGLFVCEQVIVEAGTNNVSLINSFTRRRVDAFPSPPVRFVVFAALTGGDGDVTIRVQVSRLEDEAPVYSRRMAVRFADRVQEVRFVLRLSDVSFPEAGTYGVELWADDEWLAQTVIQVSGL